MLFSLTLTTMTRPTIISFFFFNDTATTEIYTLSLHDALPISVVADDDFARTRNHDQLTLGVADVAHRAVEADGAVGLGFHARGDGSARSRSEERRVGKECRSRWSPYH